MSFAQIYQFVLFPVQETNVGATQIFTVLHADTKC